MALGFRSGLLVARSCLALGEQAERIFAFAYQRFSILPVPIFMNRRVFVQNANFIRILGTGHDRVAGVLNVGIVRWACAHANTHLHCAYAYAYSKKMRELFF